MQNYPQWSAYFASYFTILGMWTAFGPAALLVSSPTLAPVALACITLAYFVATPLAHRMWLRFGFEPAVMLMSAGVALFLALAALMPVGLAVCAPLALFFGSGTYNLCETRLIDLLAQQGRGHAFASARKWGSSGFLLAASAGGAVFAGSGVGRNFAVALSVCALAYLVCCAALCRATRRTPQGAPSALRTQANAQDNVKDNAQEPGQATLRSIWRTASRSTRLGAAAIAAMRLAEAVSTTWFGAYWLHTGHSALETGLLCALPVAAEFLAMWKGAAIAVRWSAAGLMMVSCLFSAVRWLATPFCDAVWCALPIQAIHAFTFGFFYPVSLIWLRSAFGAHFYQARYYTESVARACTALVTFLAAQWVIATLGYGAIYGLCVVLAVGAGCWWLHVVRQPAAREPVGLA